MNKIFRVSAMALALFAGASFAADNVAYNINQLPQLRQEPQHATVSERVTSRFTRSHYRQFDLNDDFSKKIFARYLNMLDYNHNVLLASDVAQFKDRETTLDDELKSGQLDTAYALFNLAQKRRFERYEYAPSMATTLLMSTVVSRRGQLARKN